MKRVKQLMVTLGVLGSFTQVVSIQGVETAMSEPSVAAVQTEVNELC